MAAGLGGGGGEKYFINYSLGRQKPIVLGEALSNWGVNGVRLFWQTNLSQDLKKECLYRISRKTVKNCDLYSADTYRSIKNIDFQTLEKRVSGTRINAHFTIVGGNINMMIIL